MKKQLLCTSAIALGVAAAAPASAQEWDLDWGGYMSSHVAVVDTDGPVADNPANDFDGLSIFNTGEIQFTPSVTLDNGMTFGINVQLEAQNQSANGDAVDIDESYLTIKSDTFGQIDIGAENSAGYKMSIGAPEVTTMWINSPSFSAFVPISSAVNFNFRQAAISSYAEVAGNNDVNRITYYTPSFNGFKLGVSYAPTANGNANQGFFAGGTTNNRAAGPLEDIWDIGVSYSQSFGTVDVDFGARYGEGSATVAAASDPSVWGVGLNVGFSGFTIGGGYTENDNGNGSFGPDQNGWSFGGTYETGAWTFEALTYQGEWEDAGTGGDDQTYEGYKIGAKRALGPGVSWDLYAIYVEGDDEGTNDTELEATIVGTAINLSF